MAVVGVPVVVPAGTVMQVAEARVGAGRGVVRVLVTRRDGEPLPMRVSIPLAVELPGVGAFVVFSGLRVELRDVGGRCRAVVRADGVEEVMPGVRAA